MFFLLQICFWRVYEEELSRSSRRGRKRYSASLKNLGSAKCAKTCENMIQCMSSKYWTYRVSRRVERRSGKYILLRKQVGLFPLCNVFYASIIPKPDSSFRNYRPRELLGALCPTVFKIFHIKQTVLLVFNSVDVLKKCVAQITLSCPIMVYNQQIRDYLHGSLTFYACTSQQKTVYV